MDAATWWAAVGAAGTVVAAGIAAWAARQSHNAAVGANAAAESLASIERGRRHDEIVPEFDLTFTETWGDDANLRVRLSGGGLEELDEGDTHHPGRSRQRALVPQAVCCDMPADRAPMAPGGDPGYNPLSLAVPARPARQRAASMPLRCADVTPGIGMHMPGCGSPPAGDGAAPDSRAGQGVHRPLRRSGPWLVRG